MSNREKLIAEIKEQIFGQKKSGGGNAPPLSVNKMQSGMQAIYFALRAFAIYPNASRHFSVT